MASVLRTLSDEHLERVHHMMRRDAFSDVAIAREAEKLAGKSIWPTDAARQRAVARYRKGRHYRDWLARYRAELSAMEREIAANRQRYEMLLNAVKGADGEGFDAVSNAVLGDLLSVAAMMPAEEKVEAFKRGGWLRNLVAAVQRQAQLNLADVAKKAEDVAGDPKLSEVERRRRMREIFKVGEKTA